MRTRRATRWSSTAGLAAAPLYDLVSTTVYEGLARKLAMKLGGENRPRYVRGRHLDRLAADLG